MNVVKRRWPDLLIGLLAVLLLAGFAALLLGKNGSGTPAVAQTQNAGTRSTGTPGTETQTPATQSPAAQNPAASTPAASTPAARTPAAQTPGDSATPSGTPAATPDTGTGSIPTIAASPVTGPDVAATTPPPATDAAPTTPTTNATPRAGGAVPVSEARSPTRNDYRISLGSYADPAAVQAATAEIGKLGYTVYPVAVTSGVVAELGPFATRELAAQALADVQRAMPGALLYSPRNAPATGEASTGSATGTAATTGTAITAPASSGPVYLQVGAYNTTAGAQTAVERARELGLEPSVNAPAGQKVTVVVGPFQGQALADAEAKLEAGGVDYFRVR